MKKIEKSLLTSFILGALVPTPIYFFSLWYYEFITTKELVGLFTSIKLWMFFVGIYYPLVAIFLKRKFSVISNYLRDEEPNKLREVQKLIRFLPKFYIVNVMLYALLGSGFAVIPEVFFSSFEKMITITLGFSFVFVYTLPFYIYTVKLIEKWTSPIPLSDDIKFISIKHKLSISILGMVIGIFVLTLTLNLGVIMANSNSNTEELLEILVSKNIVLGVLFGIIILINYIMTSKQLIDPIIKTTDMFKCISQGDLTKRIEINSRDEIGVLKKWCDLFVEKSHEIVFDVRKGAAKINSSSDYLTENINEIAKSLEIIDEEGKEMTSRADHTSQTIEKVTYSLTNMDNSIKTILSNALQANEQGDKTINISQQGKKTVHDAMFRMNNVYEIVNSLLSNIENLSKTVEKIDKITKAINDVTRQTNLLALNASIEAARAGEHGKGFAVVASSISELSEKSYESTSNIEKLVKDIQEITLDTVNTTKGDIEQIQEGIESIKTLEAFFENIYLAIEETSKLVNQITISTNKHVEESNGVMDFVSSVNEMSITVSSMVKEQVISIDKVLKSLEKISSLDDIESYGDNSTVNKLNFQAKKLYDLVSHFNVG